MRDIMFGFFLLLTITGHSVPAQPYWVIETNFRERNFTIIKFYNDKHLLIYEQKQEGVYFDLSKKRHKKKLDSMLENYLLFGSPVSKKTPKRKSSRQF